MSRGPAAPWRSPVELGSLALVVCRVPGEIGIRFQGAHSTSSEEDDLDPGGLDEIDESECWRLLATQSVVRVAVIVGHYPLVFPVNHLVDALRAV